MSGIVLSSAVRQNLLALQNTASLMATTQNDLATGNKVNSALDNPTNFFTASGLNNRASDISNLLDGISNGVQVLQAANTGITSLQSLVSQAQSIANQALQTSIGYSTKANISTTITGATASNLLGSTYTAGTYTGTALVDTITSSPPTVSGASKLSGGTTSVDGINPAISAGQSLTVDGKTISFVASGGAATSISATGSTINLGTGTIQNVLDAINAATGATTASISSGAIVLTTGTTADLTIGGTAATALGLATGGTSSSAGYGGSTVSTTGTTTFGAQALSGTALTIPVTNDGVTTSATITFGTGNGQVSTLDELNSSLAADNLQATLTSAGVLTISTSNDAASGTIGTLTGSATTATGSQFNPATAGTNYTLTSTPVADPTSQATRANLVSQYNAILTQITNTAADSSYNGINLLSGDQLQLTFNETGKSKVNITGVDFSAAGLGLSNLVSGTAFIDNNQTNTVLSTLNSVSSTLRSQASAFGSNLSVVQTRQDFNKSLINVLQTGSANLTQADINEEAANSQALSTRQSLSISALSLANQAQQSVLQLLR